MSISFSVYVNTLHCTGYFRTWRLTHTHITIHSPYHLKYDSLIKTRFSEIEFIALLHRVQGNLNCRIFPWQNRISRKVNCHQSCVHFRGEQVRGYHAGRHCKLKWHFQFCRGEAPGAVLERWLITEVEEPPSKRVVRRPNGNISLI